MRARWIAGMLVLAACRREDTSPGEVQSVLMGTFARATRRHQRNDPPPDAVTLLDVTGLADSLLVLTTEGGCGFSAWSANGQSGPVAVEGRTGEAFDLAHPLSWTSLQRSPETTHLCSVEPDQARNSASDRICA